MQGATIAMISTAAPVQNAAAATQAHPASGLPVFAQMLAQNAAAPSTPQADAPATSTAQNAAASSASANSSVNTLDGRIALKNANVPGSTRRNATLGLPGLAIDTPIPILLQPIGVEACAPAVATAAVGPCGVLDGAVPPVVGTGFASSGTQTAAGVATSGAAQFANVLSVAPNTLVTDEAIEGATGNSETPAPIDENSSGEEKVPAATTAGNDLAQSVSTLGGAVAAATPLSAVAITSVTQDAAANQMPPVLSAPLASVPVGQGDGSNAGTGSTTTAPVQDAAASQAPALSLDQQPPAPEGQREGASAGTSSTSTPVMQVVPASQASAPLSEGGSTSISTDSIATAPVQDATPNQTPTQVPNPMAPTPPSLGPQASKTETWTTTLEPRDVVANLAFAQSPNPKEAASSSQNLQAGKAASSAPTSKHAKPTTAPFVNNGVAATQPQLPTVGDLLRQVAAVTGKASAQAAQFSTKVMNDSLGSPAKNAADGQANTAMKELQSSAARSTVVGSQQASAEAASMPKGNSAGAGSTAGQGEEESAAAPGPDAKGNSATPSVDLTGVSSVAHQNVADGSGNLPGSSAMPATVPFAKDDAPSQNVAAPDSSRSDSTTNPALDKPDMDASTSRIINSAQLGGNSTHSEMHIAMQADKLGAVELHARVTGEQVGAAITVEKKEAHAALAVELPTLQQALAEKSLRVGNVVLMQGALHSTAGGAGDLTGRQPRSQPGTFYSQQQAESSLPSVLAAAPEPSGIFDDRGRLNVHA